MKKNIDFLFQSAKEKFTEWAEKKPTGTFSIIFNVNEGGVRDKPKIIIAERLS